jgi:hypothetical protein
LFGHFETILTRIALGTSIVAFVVFGLRIRYLVRHIDQRIRIQDERVPGIYAAGKILLAISLLLIIPGILYNAFIVLLPASVIRDYAKLVLTIAIGSWLLFEFILCFSIEEKSFKGTRGRKLLFGVLVAVMVAGNGYLYFNVLTSLPFPPKEECLMRGQVS